MSEFVSAIIGALVVSVPVWYTWLVSAQRQMERELLAEALKIQALKEAWHLESGQKKVQKISDEKEPLPVEPNGDSVTWLQNVEIRAVLDIAAWNYPGDIPPCFGLVSGRLAWIIRD